MNLTFWLFILTGLISGVLGGMGMGGGTVLIPILTIFLKVEQHLAQAVNLVSFVPMALVTLIFHIKNKLVEKKGILFIIIPAVVFSVVGSIVSVKIKGQNLSRFFGGFLLILSVIQFFSHKITEKFSFKLK
ncbi:MAG: sulfite exporter TauE/SafE family protein [Clostridia bacterium]|nr:sulfite exporter TauE/SafE family protein [Clostridia bacterium]